MKEPVIVSSSQIGTGCWSSVHFMGGVCNRLESCSYPEKKTCKAHINKTRIIRSTYNLMANGDTMTDHDYDQDPIMKKNFLYVGDTVLHEGKETKVESISTIENSTLDGTSVSVIPWMSKDLFTVTLANGKWAYGAQILPKDI